MSELWERARHELKVALELAAHEQRLVTYTDLVAEVKAFRIDPHSVELVTLLCEQIDSDAKNDRPLLSSIVAGRRTNRPGRGFFQYARQHFQIDDDEIFWLNEVDAVHASFRRRRGRSPVRTPHRIALKGPAHPEETSENDFIMSFFD